MPNLETTQDLAARLGQILIARNFTVTAAESCTGGMISAAFTDIAGSSVWFGYGFVSYSNQAKQELLGVPEATLDRFGAVSEETVAAMVNGALETSGADLAVAVSGVAGPDGGSAEKPVGTVWIAWGGRNSESKNQKFLFAGDRASVREQTVLTALKGLLELVQNH